MRLFVIISTLIKRYYVEVIDEPIWRPVSTDFFNLQEKTPNRKDINTPIIIDGASSELIVVT